jgi:hypothetical protein
MSSRLVRTPSGRAVAVVITTPLPDLEVGCRFRVLGTEIGGSGFRFTGEVTGRPPLPVEATEARRRVSSADRRVYTAEVRVRALELVDAGMSWAAPGREVGVPKPTIGQWVSARRNGHAVASPE